MISILISTIDERIENAPNVLLSPREDVEYVISHQYTDEKHKNIPDELKREDVTISQIPGKGVSASRNNAIKLASGDIALLADDDVTYRHHYIDIVKRAFLTNPDMDVALFKIKTAKGEPAYKNYPGDSIELKKKMFAVSTIEIGFNLKSIRELGLHFDERFGLGHKYLVGSEETIFVEDCLKQGLKVIYIPEFVVEHPHKSTGDSISKFDKRKNWITGAYDCRTNGSIALVKAMLGTVKILPELLKNKVNPLAYFYHRLSAVIYILRTNKREQVYDYSSEESSEEKKSKFSAPLINI